MEKGKLGNVCLAYIYKHVYISHKYNLYRKYFIGKKNAAEINHLCACNCNGLDDSFLAIVTDFFGILSVFITN